MAPDKFYPYTRQWIDESDIKAVTAALKDPMITRGPKVEEFERAIADHCEARYAVAFNNGTSALHAAYYAAEVGPFDRILTSPNTFVGTVTGAAVLGAAIDFVDIDPATGNLDLERFVIPPSPSRGRLVYVPVHFSGVPVDMVGLNRAILQPNAVVIEDGSQAFGSLYTDKRRVGCCQRSDMTVFSFHPAKTITSGEGGIVTTNEEGFLDRLRSFRNNGQVEGKVTSFTGNFHMTGLAAALGISQLQRVDKIVKKRRSLVRLYRKLLAEVPHVQLLPDTHDAASAHHLLVTLIDFSAVGKTRDAVQDLLKEKGVGTQVHHTPLYRHPAFKRSAGSWEERYPGTEEYFSRALSLPLYYGLTEGNVKKVVSALAEALA